MEINQKLNMEMAVLNMPKPHYDKYGNRYTTISFDVRDLSLNVEKELAMQASQEAAFINVGIDFLQATMILDRVDSETGVVTPGERAGLDVTISANGEDFETSTEEITQLADRLKGGGD